MMISKLMMWGGERRYTKMLVASLLRTLHTYERAHIGSPTQETPSLEPSPAKAGGKPATGTRSGSGSRRRKDAHG